MYSNSSCPTPEEYLNLDYSFLHPWDFAGEAHDYEDIVTVILDSLKGGHTDYCYTQKEAKQVLQECKKHDLSILYCKVLDKNNDLDYYKFIPAYYYTHDNDKKIRQSAIYNMTEVPNHLQVIVKRNNRLMVVKQFDDAFQPHMLLKLQQ